VQQRQDLRLLDHAFVLRQLRHSAPQTLDGERTTVALVNDFENFTEVTYNTRGK